MVEESFLLLRKLCNVEDMINDLTELGLRSVTLLAKSKGIVPDNASARLESGYISRNCLNLGLRLLNRFLGTESILIFEPWSSIDLSGG